MNKQISPLWLQLNGLRSKLKGILSSLILTIVVTTFWCSFDALLPQNATAFPIYAQLAYDNPREATGRIVCANCHLAQKNVEVELPQAVLPDTVFKAIVKVPYDYEEGPQQVLGDGNKGPLNVGAVLMLPEGFKLAPQERLSEELAEEVGAFYYLAQPYSPDQENILVAGPLPGADYEEMVFPILSPDPRTDSGIYYGKYAVHVGGNRGRGQIYPTGDSTNNTVYVASIGGVITKIADTEAGYDVTIKPEDGKPVVDSIPPGPDLIVAEGDAVEAGAPLTNNPNVGGFGQEDTEIVLQSSTRVAGLLVFFGGITLTQIMLVLKKKQIEKVQLAEMDF